MSLLPDAQVLGKRSRREVPRELQLPALGTAPGNPLRGRGARASVRERRAAAGGGAGALLAGLQPGAERRVSGS